QEDIATHPAAIKRAVTETAVPLPGQSPWANGAGMLQVDAAYEHLVNYHDDRYTDVTFHARGPGNTRGIYLREPYETDEPSEISVSFRAEWLEDADNRRKTDFDMRLAIEATEPWIETAPGKLMVHEECILVRDGAPRFLSPRAAPPLPVIEGPS
ncbi:MAG: hypothetical protein AAFQ75_12380, partial [Pseudomonadota bacterium]